MRIDGVSEAIVVLCALLAIATDLRHRRIPNAVVAAAALAAVVAHAAEGTILSCATGAAAGVAWLFLPWYLGGIGAGDVKLLGALCAWSGWPVALAVILLSAVFGGVLSLATLFGSGRRAKLPYGPAICLAFFAVEVVRWAHLPA